MKNPEYICIECSTPFESWATDYDYCPNCKNYVDLKYCIDWENTPDDELPD